MASIQPLYFLRRLFKSFYLLLKTKGAFVKKNRRKSSNFCCPDSKESPRQDIKEIRKKYWEYTLPELKKSVPDLFAGKNTTDRSAIDSTKIHGRYIHLSCIATADKVIVGVYIRTGKKETAKAIFDHLYSQKKEIEVAVSTQNVDWTWTENDLDANIRCVLNASILNTDEWERCRMFHAKTSKELYDFLLK